MFLPIWTARGLGRALSWREGLEGDFADSKGLRSPFREEIAIFTVETVCRLIFFSFHCFKTMFFYVFNFFLLKNFIWAPFFCLFSLCLKNCLYFFIDLGWVAWYGYGNQFFFLFSCFLNIVYVFSLFLAFACHLVG